MLTLHITYSSLVGVEPFVGCWLTEGMQDNPCIDMPMLFIQVSLSLASRYSFDLRSVFGCACQEILRPQQGKSASQGSQPPPALPSPLLLLFVGDASAKKVLLHERTDGGAPVSEGVIWLPTID